MSQNLEVDGFRWPPGRSPAVGRTSDSQHPDSSGVMEPYVTKAYRGRASAGI